MTDLIWKDLYDQAVQNFGGQTPGRDLETHLLTVFADRPVAVQAALTKTANRFAAGKIHTPWPIVKRELEHDAQRAHITAPTTPEKGRDTRLAELSIKNALHYLPSEAELLDEIFGRTGRLRSYETDQDLRQHIINIWTHERTRGIAAHKEALELAANWRPQKQPPTDKETQLHAAREWITTHWATPDLTTALLAQFPNLNPHDLPALLQLAAECQTTEFQGHTT